MLLKMSFAGFWLEWFPNAVKESAVARVLATDLELVNGWEDKRTRG
jgi:hypothetical protein